MEIYKLFWKVTALRLVNNYRHFEKLYAYIFSVEHA